MGLFTRLEKFDQKLTRGYARWGRWVWRMLIAIPVAYFLLCVGISIWGAPTGGVILVIHSELDRPILGFSVNGMAGANAFAHGGGSTTCCGDIRGKEAEVVWTLSTTRAQYNTGLREEVRRITLPLPERKHGQDFCMYISCLVIRFWVGVKELVRPMRNEKNLLIRVEKIRRRSRDK